MRRPVKSAGILLIAVLIILQFLQPERNLESEGSDIDLMAVLSVPDQVAVLLKNSCYDCHSNRTAYPWYSRISPVSWYLASHIREGKAELNLSEFGNLEKSRKVGALGDICDVIDSGAMPLKSYLLIHRNARIGQPGMDALCSWSEAEAMKILREGTSP